MLDDESIIALFHSRSEKAIAEVEKKYGKLCYRISYGILHNHADAEECVNDTYLGAWNKIPPANPHPLSAFLCKIARNLSIKRYHQNTAVKRDSRYDVAMEELDDCLASPDSVESESENERLTEVIENFLDTLSETDRVIFLRRYWFSDSYAAIAQQVGITEKNVSVRLTRTRKVLRAYLIERGIMR